MIGRSFCVCIRFIEGSKTLDLDPPPSPPPKKKILNAFRQKFTTLPLTSFYVVRIVLQIPTVPFGNALQIRNIQSVWCFQVRGQGQIICIANSQYKECLVFLGQRSNYLHFEIQLSTFFFFYISYWVCNKLNQVYKNFLVKQSFTIPSILMSLNQARLFNIFTIHVLVPAHFEGYIYICFMLHLQHPKFSN